jgi:tetratricopeptide (TPR) repeat protein
MHSRAIAVVLFPLVTLAAAPASWQADREQALRQHAAGNYREAEHLFRSALASLKVEAPDDLDIPEILNDLGADCHMLGKYAEAEHYYRDALAAWRSRPDAPPDVIGRALSNLATTYRARGLFAEAEGAYRDALGAIGETRYPAQYAFTLANLADLYCAQDRFADAMAPARRAVEMLEGLGDTAASRLAFALQTLGAVERAQGRLDRADKLYRKALALSIAQNGEDHPATATAKSNLAGVALKLGNYKEAEDLSRQAMTSWRQKLGPDHVRVGIATANLAQALRLQQRYEEAGPLFEKALEILQGGERARCLADYADMNYQQGKPVTAVDLYRQALETARHAFGANHPQTAVIMIRLAEVRRGQGLYADSVKLYRAALPILEGEDLREARQKYDATLKEAARTMLVR